MKRIPVFLFFILFSTAIFAQSETSRQSATTFPENGKYEIITNPLAFRYTFMLNRKTGDTFQLVETKTGYAWQNIQREKNKLDEVPDRYDEDVYQITMSGITAKGTFLTNTLTGATWVLYSDNKTDELFWGTVN